MNENPFRWVEIYVDDMPRAKAFYESVLHGKLSKLESPEAEIWAFPMEMNKPGATGALVKMQGCKAGGASTIAYFGCDDCAIQEERAKKAGGKIHKSKFSIGQYGHIALVFDTEGNMFGLHSSK